MEGQPDHKLSKANNGRGGVLWWSNAPFWRFENGVCAVYQSDKKHTEKELIIGFRVLDEAQKENDAMKEKESCQNCAHKDTCIQRSAANRPANLPQRWAALPDILRRRAHLYT